MTEFLPSDAPLAARKWHIINNNYVIQTCDYCKKIPVTWNKREGKYATYCSTKCATRASHTKVKTTMVERYGVDNAMKVKSFKEKMISSNKNLNYVEISKKREATNHERYGVNNYVYTDEFKEIFSTDSFKKNIRESRQRIKEKILTLHDRENVMQLHFSDEVFDKLRSSEWLAEQHLHLKKSVDTIAKELGVSSNVITNRLEKNGIDRKYYYQSGPEKELHKLLESLNLTYITNDRKTIGIELDLVIPEHKLAIEYCGLFWHSTARKSDINYHRNKFLKCEAAGIRLLTIFEDEWLLHRDIVEEKIKAILHKTDKPTIFARNCVVNKALTFNTSKDFLDNNHIQGSAKGSHYYGLLHNNELVAVMVFVYYNNEYTLTRFATSCHVPGAFSKLLKAFEREYNSPRIVSFADLRWSRGDMYYINGFTLDCTIRPDYYYTKGRQIDRFHKFGFRHKLMKSKLEVYDSSLSEEENMTANGFYRIWDCGKLKFVKNK